MTLDVLKKMKIVINRHLGDQPEHCVQSTFKNIEKLINVTAYDYTPGLKKHDKVYVGIDTSGLPNKKFNYFKVFLSFIVKNLSFIPDACFFFLLFCGKTNS